MEPVGPRGTLKTAYVKEPTNLHPKLITGSGIGEWMWIFNSYLTYYDFAGVPHPMLAERLPTQENGDWVVNPDGSMLTTYHLRPTARWHDGTPVTAADYTFAYDVYTDPELPVVFRQPEPLMAQVQARDEHTVVIRWREFYLQAGLLGYRALNPLPRHLLEDKYRANKAGFTVGDDWTAGYVGNGPFRLEQWVPGSHLTARGFGNWVLGPPKLDTLEIRFIADTNTLLANLFAGDLDLLTSPAVEANEAVVARDQWVARGQGYLKTWSTRLNFVEFQFREVPGWQRAQTDLRVRQALSHAIERQGLADVVTEGLAGPSDVFMTRQDPLFPEVDRAIPKYPYDPNRTAALLADAGWRRPGVGGPVTDTAGRAMDIEIWEQGSALASAIIADNWRGVGVNGTAVVIPFARQADREYRASFPGVNTNGRSISLDDFQFVSGQIPTAQSGWAEVNRGSFSDAEVDRLFRVARASLNAQERRDATIGMHQRVLELAGFIPLYYSVNAIIAKHKVKGPVGNYGPQIGITWNIFEWEVD